MNFENVISLVCSALTMLAMFEIFIFFGVLIFERILKIRRDYKEN